MQERGALIVQVILLHKALIFPWPVNVVKAGGIAGDPFERVAEDRARRRGRQPETVRVEAPDRRFERFEDRMRIIQRLPLLPAEFVAPAPDRQRWVIALTWNDLFGGLSYHPNEFRQRGRIIFDPGAGLDEFLPDQDSQPVALFVERLGFDQPSAPNSQYVDMGILCQREQTFQLCGLRDTVHHIHRNPVPTLGVDLAPVDE